MSSSSFQDSLLDQLLAAVESGKKDIAIWGLTRAALELLERCHSLGLTSLGSWCLVDDLDTPREGRIGSCVVIPPADLAEHPLDLLVIAYDGPKMRALRHFTRVDDRKPAIILAGSEHYLPTDQEFEQLHSDLLVRSYATGHSLSLRHVFEAIKYVCQTPLEGTVLEFGMFKGGTTNFIAQCFRHFGKKPNRIIGFDAFAGFPQKRSALDLYSNPDCEFRNTKAVENSSGQLGIEVVKGDIADTHSCITGEPLIFSFFDTDNYSPVAAALPMVYEQTLPGGVIAFDHYHSIERFVYTVGERMAADEILSDKPMLHLSGTGIFVKV